MTRVGHGLPLGKVEVHSDPESMKSLARRYSGFECHAICQESRTGHNTLTMRVQNSSVHVFRQSKIVRVHNEPLHGILPAIAAARACGTSSL